MTTYEFSLRTRIVFGPDSLDRLGELAGELGVANVLLVTDRGIVGAGHADRAEQSLTAAGLSVRRFDQVRENPTTADVAACLEFANTEPVDLFVGLGGGSSIDVAKACNFLLAGGGKMEDYWGVGLAKGTLRPLIAIPTTTGTGSEVQSFALIGQEETHQKMACGDIQAAPRIAILDPVLTVTQPQPVTACTGLDAVGHAVETAVTRKRSAISMMFSGQAFALIQANLPKVLREPSDLEAQGNMLRGAAYAGIAIENSMLGAAHSMANPLTAHYGIAHGQAVGMSLPAVVRFNAEDPETAVEYAALARVARLCSRNTPDPAALEALVARLESLLETAGFSGSLAAYGVPASAAEKLAAEASEQWTAQFNPRDVTTADFRRLFESACAEPPS